ncbi:hypothetical protein BDN70DRAFT_881171 [Pholiota conissans]|uniref:PIH1 N-terminal domain-containing protein n=1 Tax=Pholiota conissans TaxID=109636 RepID=A0A9P5YXH1_9AGAR|nr:hypothetical protein BDN70DRAFT_881171 [Pholiota conissans]
MASTSRAQPQTRIQLAPKAGFCIKTTTLEPAVLPPDISRSQTQQQNAKTTLLEPAPAPRPIPQGRKVFVNIAWDANVPPPPEGSEEAVQRAMQGVDPSLGEDGIRESGAEGEEWYVPVIVSPAREDVDKAGKPSLLFDCVYNSTLKSRTLRQPEFKVFLVELGLQRIEAQTGLSLSRTVGAPNIASKGPLAPRSVLIPSALLQPRSNSAQREVHQHPASAAVDVSGSAQGKGHGGAPLIEEIVPSPSASSTTTDTTESHSKKSSTSAALPGLRGILKKSSVSASSPITTTPADGDVEVNLDAPLEWDWTTATEKGSAGSTRLRITVRVPGTPALIQNATLDVGPRSFSLHVPRRPALDLDLSLSDAEIVVRVGSMYGSDHGNVKAKEKEERDRRRQVAVERALQLKRQRDFDVEGAEAEWRLGSGEVVVFV